MSGGVDNPTFINGDDRNYGSKVVKVSNYSKEEEASGEYDPYLHRTVKRPVTNAETFFHLLKGSLGSGILSMPLAFSQAGYVVGIVSTVIIGSICTYCVSLLINTHYELCRRKRVPSMTWPTIVKTALQEGPLVFRKCAPFSASVVNIFLVLIQLGCCCAYNIFIAANIQAVADEYSDSLSVEIWMTIFLLPLILINYIRNLKLLAPFSTAANFINFGSFGIILYYLVNADITVEGRSAAGSIANFPLYFGTVLFSLEAIGVIIPLENEMKTPKSFSGPFGVLNLGMVCVVTLYVAMGFVGYLAYGSGVEDTITLNLPDDEVLAQVAKVLLATSIFITHPLQMYVAYRIVWDEYLLPRLETSRYKLLYEYIMRTAGVLLVYGLAVAIPKLALFISLFGAFCLSMLGLAFPAIIETSTFWYSLTGVRGKLVIFKNVCLVIFGIVGLVVGTYTSLEKIVEYFQGDD